MKSYWSGESFLMLNDIKQNVEHGGRLIKERQRLGPREVLPDDFARLGRQKAESPPKLVTRFFSTTRCVIGVGVEPITTHTHTHTKMLKGSACRGVGGDLINGFGNGRFQSSTRKHTFSRNV